MFEYIAPYASATFGGWTTSKASLVRVTSSSVSPVDTCEIRVPTEGITVAGIERGMDVEAYMGYREKGVWPVFNGKISDVQSERSLIVYGRDMMEVLRQTRITKTFVDAVPQEIIKYSLGKAGITNYQLDAQQFPKKHHFVARDITVVQLIKLVGATWGIDRQFYFEPEGLFYWGRWEQSPRYNAGSPVATLEYGQNILKLEPSEGGTGILQTFLLPFIKHSNIIIIRDARFWDNEVMARIERVTYSLGEGGSEMELQWQILRK